MILYGRLNHIFQRVLEFYFFDFEGNQIKRFLKFFIIDFFLVYICNIKLKLPSIYNIIGLNVNRL